MVELSRILKAAAQDIYCHSGQHLIREKSPISLKLNEELNNWKAQLPPFLNLDIDSLNDAESAYKQKLVLKMRTLSVVCLVRLINVSGFHNARIVINRPFLVASYSSHHSSEFSQHVDICLDAARKTIQLIHNAFVNRIYLRTWYAGVFICVIALILDRWYCTTYTLYASMIILYFVLIGFPKIAGEELMADVEKSLEIFEAMEQVVVARRCAELTKEMVTVAKKHLQDLRQKQASNEALLDQSLIQDLPAVPPNGHIDDDPWIDHSLAAILDHELPGWDKASALANLYDPNVLEDFALSGWQAAGSVDTMMDFSGGSYYETEQRGPMWGVFEPFEKDDILGTGQGPFNSTWSIDKTV